MLVYLAGPINGRTWQEATEWRREARHALQRYEIRCLSPLRDKEHLIANGPILQHTYDEPLSNAPGIVARDSNDVRRCDMVLANFLGASKVSVGTCYELAWAWAWGKPVCVVMESGNLHEHPFVTQCAGFVVRDLPTAIEIVRSVLWE